jgi:hypothetical protein
MICYPIQPQDAGGRQFYLEEGSQDPALWLDYKDGFERD